MLRAPQKTKSSRDAMIAELNNFGLNADKLGLLDEEQLTELISGVNRLLNNEATPDRSKPLKLLPLDRAILYKLLTSNKEVTCASLAREFKVPVTTAQRRLKRLESLFEHAYSIKPEMVGVRPITFFITLQNGAISRASKDILEIDRVVSVTHVFNGKLDLKVEAFVKDDSEFIDLEGKIKSVRGVSKLFWLESIKILGQNDKTLEDILGSA